MCISIGDTITCEPPRPVGWPDPDYLATVQQLECLGGLWYVTAQRGYRQPYRALVSEATKIEGGTR